MRDEPPPLKLEKARFTVQLDKLGRGALGRGRLDQVSFVVTDQSRRGAGADRAGRFGRRAGALHAGLDRRAGLAAGRRRPDLRRGRDPGIGGATATAVGERLKRLSAAFPDAGHHPFAAGRGDGQPALVRRQGDVPQQRHHHPSPRWTRGNGARRSRACRPAPPSPTKRAAADKLAGRSAPRAFSAEVRPVRRRKCEHRRALTFPQPPNAE